MPLLMHHYRPFMQTALVLVLACVFGSCGERIGPTWHDSGVSGTGPFDGGADQGIPSQTDALEPLEVAPVPDGGCVLGPMVGLIQHSCRHALHGPFAHLLAAMGTEATPSVSTPHTAYQLTLSKAGEEWRGRVALRMRAEAKVSMFLSRPVDVSIRASTGEEVFGLHVDDGAVTWCPELARVVSASLGMDTYTIFINGGGFSTVMLVIESPEVWECTDERARSMPTVVSGAGAQQTMCRSSGPCTTDSECCEFCHDFDHCH